MEVIPQRVFTYGDGIPAVKSGEWPGIRPSHWNGSKLILKPLKKNKISAFERMYRYITSLYCYQYN